VIIEYVSGLGSIAIKVPGEGFEGFCDLDLRDIADGDGLWEIAFSVG